MPRHDEKKRNLMAKDCPAWLMEKSVISEIIPLCCSGSKWFTYFLFLFLVFIESHWSIKHTFSSDMFRWRLTFLNKRSFWACLNNEVANFSIHCLLNEICPLTTFSILLALSQAKHNARVGRRNTASTSAPALLGAQRVYAFSSWWHNFHISRFFFTPTPRFTITPICHRLPPASRYLDSNPWHWRHQQTETSLGFVIFEESS